MKAKSTFSLKDELFNPEKIAWLSSRISGAYPDFPKRIFERDIIDKLPELELKERIVHIAGCLRNYLPDSYPGALRIIVKSLPPELDPGQSDNDFGDYILAPLSHFVAIHGCSRKHLDRSFSALEELTKRFSVEDAIRYFINAFPDESFEFLERCSQSNNYHVRRLASEGSRPRLPWSQKLVSDYDRPVAILHRLHGDDTRYVTRSVANHVNDISKLDPDFVIDLLRQWRKEGRQSKAELNYVTRHALRTLVKQGHSGAFQLLGYGSKPDLSVLSFSTDTPTVMVGGACHFSLEIKSHRKQRLLIDYLMEFPDGRSKVFKWKQVELRTDEECKIVKSHPMRLMTTRSLVPGVHRIVLQINGAPWKPDLEFSLAGSP